MRLIGCVAVVALAGLATAGYLGGAGSGAIGPIGGYNAGAIGARGGAGFLGRFYFSFLDPFLAGHQFTWFQAHHQCRIRGLQLVSLDNYFKNLFVSQVIRFFGIPWIWTSGNRLSTFGFVWATWQPVSFGFTNWSFTGSLSLPQPDNAAGNEFCLAVLNHFYHDGIVWHDIACHHRKFFVCELPYHI